ncbi:NB-ARC domain-containing protein [Leptothermofonsia sp. ETS-13]|uniref:NB-ARC domain-containing protein n=1 Tax=Leptothermofonsia sp. ETS-13 TaxID=3035696 RepID=UPI003BA01AF2
MGSKLWQQISQAVGEQVTKKNLQTVLRRQLQQNLDGCESSTLIQVDLPRQATPQEAWRSPSVEGRQYWEEAIDVSVFYGRTTELSLLEQWILQDRCRIVTVLGMGGMGKTTLVTRLAHILQHQFDILI